MKLKEGLRPGRPQTPSVPDSAWTLMQRCWELEPQARPSFSDLSAILDLYCGVDSTTVKRVSERISKRHFISSLSGWPDLSQRVVDLITYAL